MTDPIGEPGLDPAAAGIQRVAGAMPAFGGLRWNADAAVLEVRRLTYATVDERAAFTAAVERLIAGAAWTVEARLVDADTSDPAGDAQAKAVWAERASWASDQVAHLNGAFYDHRSETVVVFVAPGFDAAAVTPPHGAFPVEFRGGVIRPLGSATA